MSRACWVPIALVAWIVWVIALSRSAPHTVSASGKGCQQSLTRLVVFQFDENHPRCRVQAPVEAEEWSEAGSTGIRVREPEEDERAPDHIEALDDSYGVLGP